MAVTEDRPGHAWAAPAVGFLRIFSLLAALALWVAWSEAVFYLILGLAFAAFAGSALIARFVPGGNEGFTRTCGPDEE